MKMHFVSLIISLMIIPSSCDRTSGPEAVAEARPAPLSPVAPISLNVENPHYFDFQGKPTVLITSGEHYGSVINLDFDYKTYLDEIQSRGFNLTRLFAGPYVEFAGWYQYTADQPLSPLPGRFICPWSRSNEPGYINGGNKFDLMKWDEQYFSRLKDFFTEAKKRGIVVELTLFSPYYDAAKNSDRTDPDLLWKYSPLNAANNINGIGTVPRTKVLTMDNGNLLPVEDAYVAKLVSELKNFDNLIYEICNEPYIQGLVSHDWMNHISQVIDSVESGFEYKHLKSQNVANFSQVIDNPVTGVSVFNFHYGLPSAISLNYGLNKVIGNNETDGFASNTDLRVEAWEIIMAGGGLFNNLDMSFTIDSPDGGPHASGRGLLRKQIGALKDFIERFDFVHMKPDSLFSDSAIPGIKTLVLDQPGVAWAIYLHATDLNDTKGITASLPFPNLPSGTYQVDWIDPSSGQAIEVYSFDHSGGAKNLKTPLFQTDIALDLRRSGNE